MATIHVDGKQLEVNGADNLLQACLSLGLDIPYFCWHPALGSVGSCRQCAVKQFANADDKRGRLVMSCMTPSADNTYISIDDDEAKAFRASMIELLMSNHPHDCPVCEEGGHCHLQDMTVMSGHDTRRYRFTKRTHENQYLGTFISHEMNRCIACYRCVRYYKDYAGGTDLGVYGSASNVYFGREKDGVLESEFSGNLVEVCPTGVFTDKTHSARYNRKWDMQYAPSICQGCSSGCNISAGERYGELRRIENRFNGDVNQYFLCDKGRFGYGFVNRTDRPRQPLQKIAGDLQQVSVDTALDQAIAHLTGKKILGIGSPRASLETNFALRELVGINQFSTGMTRQDQALAEKAAAILQTEGIYTPTLREIESYDAVLILGEDITQTAARVALSVRQAAKNEAVKMAEARRTQEWLAEPVKRIGQNVNSPVFILSVAETRLSDIAEGECVATPNDIARLGFAVAAALVGQSVSGMATEAVEFAKQIASKLQSAKKPLIISGSSLKDPALLEAAAQIAQNLGASAGLTLVVPEVNSMGSVLLGGLPLEEALLGDYDALVVAENDLFSRLPKAIVQQVLSKTQNVIVLDHQHTDTVKRAGLVLPAASFAEADGTVVSLEGRAQRFFQVFDPSYLDPTIQIKESWRWLHAIKAGLNQKAIEWTILDDVIDAIVRQVPALAGIVDAAPNAGYRVGGLKIAREPRRYSGRTAMRAPLSVHEPKQPVDVDSGLTFSMEGYVGDQTDSALIPFAWAPGWNSPQSWNKFQDEVGGHLKGGDSGVRLFDRLPKRPARQFIAPDAEQIALGQFRLTPLFNLFASGEMSSRVAVFKDRQPEPVFALCRDDAESLQVTDGQMLSVSVGTESVVLPVKVVDYLPIGLIGYPVGQAAVLDMNQPVAVAVTAQAMGG